jgi:hypothetical protein
MKPFYAKIYDKRTGEQVAGWNVSHIDEAVEEVQRIFCNPNFFTIVLERKSDKVAIFWKDEK